MSPLRAESLLTTKSMELKAGTFDRNLRMHPSARFNPSFGTRERMPKRHDQALRGSERYFIKRDIDFSKTIHQMLA